MSIMKKSNIKSNKAVSLIDVIIAMLILSLFVGVVGNLYYLILKNNNLIRYDTIAVYYAIKIAEDIDKMSYEEVTSTLNNNVSEKYSLPENITGLIEIENYNNSTKQDIIKKVKITIKYNFLEEERKYEIKKLKIKEM